MKIPDIYNITDITADQIEYATGCLDISHFKHRGCTNCRRDNIGASQLHQCPNCGKEIQDYDGDSGTRYCECGSRLVLCKSDSGTMLIKFTVDNEIVKDMKSGEDII